MPAFLTNVELIYQSLKLFTVLIQIVVLIVTADIKLIVTSIP